jgi:hypothetical protein
MVDLAGESSDILPGFFAALWKNSVLLDGRSMLERSASMLRLIGQYLLSRFTASVS